MSYLGNVQGILESLAVAENDKHTGLPDGGADALHLVRVLDERVAEVLVHEGGIVGGGLGPDAPFDGKKLAKPFTRRAKRRDPSRTSKMGRICVSFSLTMGIRE